MTSPHLDNIIAEFNVPGSPDTSWKLLDALAAMLRQARQHAGFRTTDRSMADLVADVRASDTHHKLLVEELLRRKRAQHVNLISLRLKAEGARR